MSIPSGNIQTPESFDSLLKRLTLQIGHMDEHVSGVLERMPEGPVYKSAEYIGMEIQGLHHILQLLKDVVHNKDALLKDDFQNQIQELHGNITRQMKSNRALKNQIKDKEWIDQEREREEAQLRMLIDNQAETIRQDQVAIEDLRGTVHVLTEENLKFKEQVKSFQDKEIDHNMAPADVSGQKNSTKTIQDIMVTAINAVLTKLIEDATRTLAKDPRLGDTIFDHVSEATYKEMEIMFRNHRIGDDKPMVATSWDQGYGHGSWNVGSDNGMHRGMGKPSAPNAARQKISTEWGGPTFIAAQEDLDGGWSCDAVPGDSWGNVPCDVVSEDQECASHYTAKSEVVFTPVTTRAKDAEQQSTSTTSKDKNTDCILCGDRSQQYCLNSWNNSWNPLPVEVVEKIASVNGEKELDIGQGWVYDFHAGHIFTTNITTGDYYSCANGCGSIDIIHYHFKDDNYQE